MKILFLTDSLNNGGAERQFSLLVKSMSKVYNIKVWSWKSGPFKDYLERFDISINISNMVHKYDPRPMLKLWELILNFRPDIIHSWGWISTMLSGPLASLLNIPIIESTVRLAIVPNRRSLLTRLSWIWAKYCVANSLAGIEAWKVPKIKARIIYNGIETNRLVNNNYIEKKGEIFTVIMTGRMEPQKDFRILIDAAYELDKMKEDIFIILVGSGIEKDLLVSKANKLVKKNIIIFPPKTLDVIPYIYKSEVGILMTNNKIHKEGCSNSILEYMACGLPVICNDSGGNRELVINGTTGFIINSNIDELIEKLLFFKYNSNIAKEMGVKGKKHVEDNFSIEKYVNNTIKLYKECLL